MYLCKIIKTVKNMYIYDALNNRVAILDSEEDILDEDKYADFLANSSFRDIKVPCEFDLKYPYSKDELTSMLSSKLKSVTLALTEQCNLRCKYCGYMPKYMDSNYHLKEMPKDIAFKAIDILMKNSQESEVRHLGFYGGEPLLRLELIKECIEYISDKYPFSQPSYSITTNAVLLDDEVADFLIRNNIKIVISFDGPEKYHNKYRVDGNGNSSCEKVYQNIQALYHKNPKFFRENVTYNVVLFNGASDELFESLNNLWAANINTINLFQTQHFMETRDKSDEINSDQSVDIKEYDFAYTNLLKGMKKYYNSFCSSTCSNAILPGGFCIPGVRKNFITTDGKILVCEKGNESQKIFEIGDVDSGIDINKVEHLVNQTLKKLEKCKCCWASKFCNICFKNIDSIDEAFCEKARQTVEKELGFYLDQVEANRDLMNYVANISLI